LAFSIYVLSVDGWEHAYSHFFIPAISLMWLLFRWGMYKKMKKHEQQR